MNCPRCGLRIPLSSLSRCPRCFQPLHPPVTSTARITKLASDSDATSSDSSLESEAWPDLNDPPILLVPKARRATLPRQATSSTGTFPVSTTIDIVRRLPVLKRTLLLAAMAAVIVGLILGGTLLAVHALTGQAPGQNSAGTGPTNTTGAASATATAHTTAPTPSVPDATSTATPAPTLVTIFSDPLTSNANGWITSDGCSFQSDGLHVSGDAQCIAPVTAADTVNISVQMKTVESGPGGAGIGFRMAKGESSHQYTFYLDFDGTCVAQDLVTHTTLFDGTCPSAHLGRNAFNTLLIDQSGAHMNFYVNGTLVGSATDATLGTGEVAVEGAKSRQTVIFTNFRLTAWE